jgi:dihydropteroate synthase
MIYHPPYRKVMSILNVTPDSFFAESRTEESDSIRLRAERMAAEGADIIDIGGYSTRPGASEVPTEEEIRRVLKGVEEVRGRLPQMQLSIDTFRSEVAEAVLSRYDNVIINDISGGERDERMAEVVAHYEVPMVVMHSRGTPQTMQSLTNYSDVVEQVREHLARRAEALAAKGARKIILDPDTGNHFKIISIFFCYRTDAQIGRIRACSDRLLNLENTFFCAAQKDCFFAKKPVLSGVIQLYLTICIVYRKLHIRTRRQYNIAFVDPISSRQFQIQRMRFVQRREVYPYNTVSERVIAQSVCG